MLRIHLRPAVTLVSFLLLTACSSSNDTPQDLGDTAANTGSDTTTTDAFDEEVQVTTSATPYVPGTVLTSAHMGWGKADCLGCHDATHGGLAAPQCIICHGTNGAKLRPTNHANDGCAACHEESHAASNFQSPMDCTSCHGYVAGDGCAFEEDVDVVVVGAGGGGLSAASRLSQAGLDVVVLERHNKVGGCMTAFDRADYRFEVSLHAMGGFNEPDGPNIKLFKELGIWGKVEPVSAGAMYRAVYPDFVFETPEDVDAYMAQLMEKFPDDAEGIERLFGDLAEAEVVLNAAVAGLQGDSKPLDDLTAENPEGVMRFLGYLDKTLSEVLVDYFTNPQLISIFAQLAAYAGQEPDKVSSLFFIMMWNSYHRHGFHYLVGGSQAVSDALADAIREHNGRVFLNSEVTDIVIEGGKAVQVKTAQGNCFNTRYVVSNANAPDTMELIGRDNLPEKYMEDMDAMTPGLPATVVYLGVDHDYTEVFGNVHEIIIQDSYNPHDVFQAGMNCDAENDVLLLVANYSVVDPTAAPEGKNVITITGLLGFDCFTDAWGNYDYYKEAKDVVAEAYLDRTEQLLPGLRDHIEVMEVAVPQTTWAYTGNHNGSFVGFDSTPEQSILNRLKQETPIPNLFLAGAWTFPGGGQATVLMSGGYAADNILALENPE